MTGGVEDGAGSDRSLSGTLAEPLRDAIRGRAQELATSAGIAIEHIAKAHIRKEEVVAKALERRGDHPGLAHIISAMEACDSYRPWHDKTSGQTFLKPDSGKCLHYYFYFIDDEVGLCYLRVPTWCPFRLQFYCNGHGWLAMAYPVVPGYSISLFRAVATSSGHR